MKVFILVDDSDIVRCMASEEGNLHSDKLWMRKFYVDSGGTVGDEYGAIKDIWISKPENYPQPSEEEVYEKMISDKIRAMAIVELKEDGKLPIDYQII